MQGKLGKHTVGMMFKTGALEVTSEIRSVPLGEKRKRGRPKKMPHCLSKSPPMSSLPDTEDDVHQEDEALDVEEDVNLQNEIVDEALDVEEDVNLHDEMEVVDVGIRSRKRKAPGLQNQKPPKKKARLPVEKLSKPPKKKAVTTKPASHHKEPSTTLAAPSESSSAPVKPIPKKCKKRIDTCSHEVVFGQHYDRKEWEIFANHVRLAKPVTQIDPEYVALL